MLYRIMRNLYSSIQVKNHVLYRFILLSVVEWAPYAPDSVYVFSSEFTYYTRY